MKQTLFLPYQQCLDNVTIFEAYTKKFDKLTAKGLQVKLNIIDNQATKYIKKFLTEEQSK